MSQPLSDLGRQRQRAIYVAGIGGRRPTVPAELTGLTHLRWQLASPT